MFQPDTRQLVDIDAQERYGGALPVTTTIRHGDWGAEQGAGAAV